MVCILDRVLVVWHLLCPLMNSFNKTDAALFPMQAMFFGGFPFFLYKLKHFFLGCQTLGDIRERLKCL